MTCMHARPYAAAACFDFSMATKNICVCCRHPHDTTRNHTTQAWLFVGVMFILGSEKSWHIPVIASAAFTATVIIVPGIYEYCLSDAQRRRLNAAMVALRLRRGAEQHSHDGRVAITTTRSTAKLLMPESSKLSGADLSAPIDTQDDGRLERTLSPAVLPGYDVRRRSSANN